MHRRKNDVLKKCSKFLYAKALFDHRNVMRIKGEALRRHRDRFFVPQ